MTIRFACPGCKTIHAVADGLGGQPFKCSCGMLVRVPPAAAPGAGNRGAARPGGASQKAPADRGAVRPPARGATPPAQRPREEAGAPRRGKRARGGLSPALLVGGLGALAVVAAVVVAVILATRAGPSPAPQPPGAQAPVAKANVGDGAAGRKEPVRERPQPPAPSPAVEQPKAPAAEEPKAPAAEGPKPAAERPEVPDPGPPVPPKQQEEAPEPELPDVQPVAVQVPPEKDRPWLVLDAGGHSSAVFRVLFTPDARRVVSVSADKTVRLWDVATGDCLRTLRLPAGAGAEGALFAGALAPDGRRLAVGGAPYGLGRYGIPIYLISLETGQVERVFKGHRHTIQDLAFSPGAGEHLASSSNDGLGAVFEVSTGKAVCVLKGHADRVRRIAWHPDGRRLATSSEDGTARIWEFPTGRPLATLKIPGAPPLGLAWAPDGKTLATGNQKRTVHLWAPDGTLLRAHPLPGPLGHVNSLAFTPTGRELLYTATGPKDVTGLLDAATGQVRVTFRGFDNSAAHGVLSADGKLAVTAGGNNDEIYVWKTEDGSVVQKFEGQGRSVWRVGWSRDGRTLAWGNTNRPSRTNPDTELGPLESTFRLDRLEFGGAPPADCTGAATAANGYSLERADAFRVAIKRQGQPLHVYRSALASDRVYSYTVVSGDRALVGGLNSLALIDLKTGTLIRRLMGHSGAVTALAPSPDGRYCLSGGDDQLLCLWDLQGKEPLLSLFVAGRDWIAWTPHGYYACSPRGERLMGWQVNNGPEKLATYYPAVQFRPSLYRPDAIRLLRRAGSLGKALAVAGLKHKGAAAAVNVTEVLPPQAVITSPAAGRLAAGQTRVEVRAEARPAGGRPVTAMRLLVDGRPFEGTQGIRAFKDGQVAPRQASWSVELPPGKHTLAVQAESPVSKGLSPPVEVTRAGAKERELPNLYVLAVGVSAYPGKLRLNYAHADAIAMASVLKEKAGGVFAKVETRLLTDKQATRQGILDGLAWLKSVMTARDVGVIFFAGHGAQDPGGNFHLVPVDVNPDDPAGSCISGESLKKALADMPGRLVAMLDACHSGASALGPAAAKGPARPTTDDLVRDLVTDDYGVVVMCSSLGHEYSLESTGTRHGFFTLGLVEGLSGKADFNRDRVIYLHEVDAYALLRVRQLSGGQQNPVTGRPPTIRSFPLARY